jgi:hypothetical protein
MTLAFPSIGACELPDPAQREQAATDAFKLDSLQWKNRVILLFANGPRDAAYVRQQELLAQVDSGLKDRDLVVIAAFADGSGMLEGRPIEQASVRALRRDFQPRANAFTSVLIGKDGTEKMRVVGKPAQPDTIFETIDSMPMRQREMKDQSSNTGK